MGRALALLVVDGLTTMGNHPWGYAHIVIPLRRGSALDDGDTYGDIEKLKPEELPKDAEISSYLARIPDGQWKDEYGYGVLKKTPYGKRYTWLSAQALTPVLRLHHPGEPATLFVAALSAHTKIILHWH